MLARKDVVTSYFYKCALISHCFLTVLCYGAQSSGDWRGFVGGIMAPIIRRYFVAGGCCLG